MNVKIPFEILGTEFAADVEVRITAKSYGGRRPDMNQPGEPAEGCEFEVDNIWVGRNSRNSPVLRSDGKWLWDAIAESDELHEAVAEAEKDEPRRGARDPDEAWDSRYDEP